VEYTRLLVPVVEGTASDEAVEVAARLAADRGARIVAIAVVQVPLNLPLDAELPEEEDRAHAVLDEARGIGDLYGVDVVTRLVRARKAGRAIVDEAVRRDAEIVVMGAPRAGRRRAIFGDTADFVLKHAPCRVLVATEREQAA
jgi:APA family basic amino acid/polyamine antiporter